MMRICCCVLVLVVFWQPSSAVVGGGPAAPPEPDAAVVFTQKHGRSARIQGVKDDTIGYYSFLGIRYAEPATGPRRFQRPVRMYIAGDVAADTHCQPCPQLDPRGSGKVIGNEDCLCLNVYTPKMPESEEGSPVVFFIHGGNYKSGSSSAYGGQHLTKHDTILVTAQYRLGSLGYLSTGQKDASGNAGMFDLHAVVTWINEYIQFFGGDPKRLVVMGQGSGGSAASLLALSGEGRAVTGVVSLSGTPLSPGAVRSDPAQHAQVLANRTGCPLKPAERLLLCLRKLSIEDIVKADKAINSDMVDTKKFLNEISGTSGAGARVEGRDDLRGLPPILSEKPKDYIEKKEKYCPLLTGVTSAETARAVYGKKYSTFLTNQLAAVKDFVKKELIGGLSEVIQGVEGLMSLTSPVNGALNQFLPLSDYYQTIFDNSLKSADGLLQIVEATGDALFNFPAYKSVQLWGSNSSPAYLYNFEHFGNLSKGDFFLPGLALTDKPEKSDNERSGKKPAHGDELAYIFEPLNEQGKTIEGEISQTDSRVRNNFVGLISKFAHNLKESGADNKTESIFFPFSKGNDFFIKINEDISMDKDFRFCQMGLWGNMADRLTSSMCKNILGDSLNLDKLPIAVPDIPMPLDVDQPSVPLVPGLLGAKTTKRPTQSQTIKKATRAPDNPLPVRLPFGF